MCLAGSGCEEAEAPGEEVTPKELRKEPKLLSSAVICASSDSPSSSMFAVEDCAGGGLRKDDEAVVCGEKVCVEGGRGGVTAVSLGGELLTGLYDFSTTPESRIPGGERGLESEKRLLTN